MHLLRAFHLFVLTIPILVFSVYLVLYAYMGIAIGKFRLIESLRLLQVLTDESIDDASASARLRELRLGDADRKTVARALRTYLSGRFGSKFADPSYWASEVRLVSRHRDLAEPLGAERPTDGAVEEAETLLAPFFAQVRNRTWMTKTLPAVMFGCSLSLMVISAFGVLSSICVPAGIGSRLLGLTLVSENGKRVSRARSLARALIDYTPVLFASIPGFFVSRQALFHTYMEWKSVLLVPIGAYALLVAGLILALRRPERSLQDRLARTYLVPAR